jgi:acetylornithine deacetylase/succinyl-diaminopimelate desuccinylase-like protein
MSVPEERVVNTGEDVVAVTRALVAARTPNPPGDERPAAELVTKLLLDYGLPAPEVIAERPERPNLLVSLPFGEGGRHLCLSGHLDTKPVGTARWRSDPYTAEIRDGDLFGLGAVDMKGAVAAMILAARRLMTAPPTAGRLSLLLTADEEDGGRWGARYVVSTGALDADGVVIGEPGGLERDFDRLHVVSRGLARFRVEVSGDQGHTSLRERTGAVNASVEMAGLLARFSDQFHPTVPARLDGLEGWNATVTAGVHVRGGIAFGVVPGLASFDAEVRLLPGMSRAQLRRDIEHFLEGQRAVHPSLQCRLIFADSPLAWLSPTEVDLADPLVEHTRKALQSVLAKDVPVCVFPGATDAAFFQGMASISTLPALGPGLLAAAHGADERVSVASLRASVDIYESLARSYCAESAG